MNFRIVDMKMRLIEREMDNMANFRIKVNLFTIIS
jgi:hypothetical protein